MGINPLSAFLKANRDLISGRLIFPRQQVGERVVAPDGQSYTIFRQAVLAPRPEQPVEPGAVFRVWFHPAGMSVAANRWFSLLPLPFCVGCPGFRSKLWMANEATGECLGVYEWDTVQAAEDYAASFAMRFSKSRSLPGKFTYQIIPGSLDHQRLLGD